MKQRIVTGLVAALLFLPLVLIGGLPFVLLIYLMATIAFFEIMRMKKVPALSRQALLSVMILWLFLIPSEYGRFFASAGLAKEEYLFALIFVLLMITVATKNEVPYETIGFCLLTVFYLGIGFYYMMEIRAAGLDLFLYALFVIWATDIGAYFFRPLLREKKALAGSQPEKDGGRIRRRDPMRASRRRRLLFFSRMGHGVLPNRLDRLPFVGHRPNRRSGRVRFEKGISCEGFGEYSARPRGHLGPGGQLAVRDAFSVFFSDLVNMVGS